MKFPFPRLALVAFTSLCLTAAPWARAEKKEETLNVLFIGNSFTARHHLADVVKAMAEAGNPGLTFRPTSVIYGGRTLADHWRLGTQNIVRIATLTEAEEKETVAALEKAIADDPADKYARSALARHRELLANLEAQRNRWDVVVLQSYRDDLDGEKSRYAEYAPRFVELARAQGARVLLYETTPATQNAEALTSPPDPAPVREKARAIAALAGRLDVAVAPMSLVALRCQTERPDLTLRFVNDAHLNQTMAYLTACAIYAGLFGKSPVGLPVDSVTDIRYLDDKTKDRDRDGDPITRIFSGKDRADLQRIAWEGHLEFEKLRGGETSE